MPETVGLAILTGLQAAGVPGIAGFALTSTTVAGVGLATIVGSATILGVSIGLQYALNNPEVPKPENGAIPIKQAIPVRQRGYWINRISGPYMLFLAGGGDSQDVLALHHGRIEAITQVYMHDTAVAVVPAVSHGTVVTVQQVGGNQFRDGAVRCEFYFGLPSQPWAQLLQTFQIAFDHAQPNGCLQTKRHRQGMLQMGTARHGRVTVFSAQAAQLRSDTTQISLHQIEARTHLQHQGRVHDVLGGGTPMQKLACITQTFGQLMHQGQDGVAHVVRFSL